MDSVYWFAEMKSKPLPTIWTAYWLLVQGFIWTPRFFLKDKNRELHGIGKEEHQFWKEKKKSFTFLRQESNVNCTDVEKITTDII